MYGIHEQQVVTVSLGNRLRFTLYYGRWYVVSAYQEIPLLPSRVLTTAFYQMQQFCQKFRYVGL